MLKITIFTIISDHQHSSRISMGTTPSPWSMSWKNLSTGASASPSAIEPQSLVSRR
jgi:hypothetical protein